MHNLKGSCDNFPTSLILIYQESENEDAAIVGHSKVSLIHRIPSACFVESGTARMLLYSRDTLLESLTHVDYFDQL